MTRDLYKDGHGFRDVPISRRPTIKVVHRYNYDVAALPTHKDAFIGLYRTSEGGTVAHIIWRADKATAGLRFLTWEGSDHPHYIEDPIGWAELPKP